MRILKLKLEQICQHELLDWKFSPGLIGVFGPNGSGKSNALNVACYGAITNDFSRHVQGKAGMVRQQIKERQKSRITVVFEHDGHKVKLVRGMQPANHRLIVGDGEELRKANDIQAAIEESLGISRRLIDRYMFVGQSELYAFLSETPATRAKSFAELCNTTHAEECWKILGEFIDKDRELIYVGHDRTDDLKVQLGQTKKHLKMIDTEIVNLKEYVLSEEEEAANKKLIASYEKLKEVQQSLNARQTEAIKLQKEIKVQQESLDECREKLKTCKAAYDEADEKAAKAKELLSNYKAQTKVWDQYQRLLKRKEGLENDFQELPEPPEKPKLSDSLENLEKEHAELFSETRQIQKLFEKLEAGGEFESCPTCGTPREHFEEHLAEQKERLESWLLPRRKAVKAELDAAMQYKHDLLDHTQTVSRLQKELDAAVEDLQNLGEVTAPEFVDELSLQQIIDQRDKALSRYKLTDEEERKLSGIVASKQGRLQEQVSEVDSLLEERESLKDIDADQVAEAEEALQHHTDSVNSIATLLGRKQEKMTIFCQLEKELKQENIRINRTRRAKRWVADMEDVRDNVMHRDKLPAIVHQHALANMEEEINSNLEMFDSPFFVKTRSDLGFEALFANGTTMPANGLSGGQKVMLALSFRLAVNSLFASQVGMMVLDEPTDGLDGDNRNLAAEVFRKLGQLAHDKGHQVIVITHDDSLRPAFDQLFVLEKAV